MKKLLLLSLALCTILSCSKDDDSSAPKEQNGGDIFTAQIVTIELPGQVVSAEEYPATLGTTDVTVVKSDEHQIMFLVPQGTEPGLKDLVVPGLGATIHYNVKETVLSQTPAETIAPMLTGLAEYAATLSSSESPEAANMETNLASFNNFMANATDKDKTQIAIAYAANKAIIDQIIANDYSNITGRITNSEKLIFVKFLASVLTIQVGSILATNGGHPSVRVLGVLIGGLATTCAIDFYAQFIQKEVKEMGITIHTLLGENTQRGGQDSELIFTHNVARTLPISTSRTKLTTADAGGTMPMVSQFFNARQKYNTVVAKINAAIQFVNSNIPFVSFGLIQSANLSATAPTSQVPPNAETFGKFQFSFTGPNLTLAQVALSAEGQITLKINFTGTPPATPVNATLNYSYADGFSQYSGKFPIKVTNELICETVQDIDGNVYNVVPIGGQCWTAKNLNVTRYRNGDVIPQIQDNTAWLNATTGAWCYFENNTANGVVYGKLYNWYAVNDPRGLAPEGYHIPSRDEWNQMKDFLGGAIVAGGKLKTTEHWQAPNVGATNETGFSAVPGSQRNGAFYTDGWGVVGVYWTSTQNPDNTDNAWSNTLSKSSSNVSEYQGSWKKVGMAVRCVKN